MAVLWLFVWSASAAQPCCEAIAALVPHHSEQATAHVHEGHGADSPREQQPAGATHHHCPEFKGSDATAPTPWLGAPSYRALLLTHLAPLPDRCTQEAAAQLVATRPPYALPPPLSPPPFLSRRLLI
jgi:hypothetical protein